MRSSAGDNNVWGGIWREQGSENIHRIFNHRLFLDSYPIFKKHFPNKINTVLELGAGSGRYGLKLAQDYPEAKVILSDILPESVGLINKLINDLNLINATSQVAAAESLPFPDNHFDLVIADCLIQHLPNPQPVLVEMIRVLKPGGRLILSGVNYWNFHTLFKTWQKWRKQDYDYGLEKSFTHNDWKKLLANYPLTVKSIDGAAVSYGVYRLKKYSSIFSLLGKIINRLVKIIDKLTKRLFSRYFGFELIVVADKGIYNNGSISLTVKNSGVVKLKYPSPMKAGWLLPLQGGQNIPFNISRTYWMGNLTKTDVLGLHAHRKIRQVIFCLAGNYDLKLDDGENVQVLTISDPSVGIILEPWLWHEMSNFSNDCRLLVLADSPYDPADYIHDYNVFKKEYLKHD